MSSHTQLVPLASQSKRVRLTGRVRTALGAGLFALTAVAVNVVPTPAQAARSWSSTIATQSQDALNSLTTWKTTKSESDRVAYELLRDKLATTIAGAIGVDAAVLRSEWQEVDLVNLEIIFTAGTQVGVPYKYLKSEKGVGFDCSGLTKFAYGAAGIELPRVSYDQIKTGEKITAEEAEPGDLAQYPGHIMMYLGGGVIMHARQTGSYVEVASKPSRTMKYADVTPDA